MAKALSRREILKRTAAVGAASALPRYALAQAARAPYTNLTPAEAQTLEALVARLIPADAAGPGALEAGASRYVDIALGDALASSRQLYAAGLAALDAYARSAAGRAFAELDAERQDTLLTDLEQNRATGFVPDSATFFNLVLGHTIEGTFSDPRYGGNRDFIGWDLIGYPGIRLAVTEEQQRMNADLTPTRISAYDLSMFDATAVPHDDGD
jgi:gluconate 2-dehydrogenase gamma chain